MTKVIRTRDTRAVKRNLVSLVSPKALVLGLAVGMGAATVPDQVLAQNYTFNSVSIEGNQRIEAGTILTYVGIAQGQRVDGGDLNDAFQRLQGSGLFEQVEIVPQGSRLVIRVTEYPTVNRISFEGNRRIKDDELASIVKSQSRRVFSPSIAEVDAQSISEAYTQQGRIAARVTPKVIRRSDNRVDLVFEVFEGGVSEIERIGFVGNGTYSDRRLRRILDTKQAGILRAVVRRDTFVEDRIEFDKQLLRDFYTSRGYVDFRITGVNAELADERDGYFVTFNVEEGQQFRVGNVSVSSELPDVDAALFQSNVKMKSGKVYSPLLVENDIARLERLAIREGLNFVRVDPRITRNDRDLTLDVELVLTRGERIFVERIDIEGNTTTLDRVVRNQFEIVEGDPFNPRAIRESAERIRALGFFENVDVQAREGSGPRQVVVDVDVEEAPTGSLNFGGSYSNQNGFGLLATFSERNFLGRGQELGFSVSTTSNQNKYAFNFLEPNLLGRDLAFGIIVDYSESDGLVDGYNTALGEFRPFFEFPVSENGRLQLRYKLGYSDIRDVDQSSSRVSGIIQREAALGQRYDSAFGYTYSYDTRRSGLNPNAGVLFQFGQDIGGLGGDSRYIKSDLRVVGTAKVLNEEVELRAAFEAGMLNYSQSTSRATDRYLLGTRQLRGFEYGGVGPREIGAGFNTPLGGEMYAVARLEAQFPLGLPEEYGISGGVFYDIGSLWGLGDSSGANGRVTSTDFKARHVIGASIFWDSALGPLRMNFTEALRKEPDDIPLNFDITISTQF